MDVVKILRDAVLSLPKGEHSAGINAILRHISAAIRHFERRDGLDQDNFTDAIYRTNQAYEGSLKEAYRVLAEKDPSRETPHGIEVYLESNNVVRPRVLTQLTRYRHDYRNPSTHDYKLDFDENEALLSIVSVCAFAKLLIDQISERLAYSEQASKDNTAESSLDFDSDKELAKFASFNIQKYLNDNNENDELEKYSAFLGGIAGHLSSTGLVTDLHKRISRPDPDEDNENQEVEDTDMWDIFVSHGKRSSPIEIRGVSDELDEKNFYTLIFMADPMTNSNIEAGVFIHRSTHNVKYNIYETTFNGITIFLLSKFDLKTINSINDEDCSFRRVK